MTGTWINVGTILLGSLIGVVFGKRIPTALQRLATAMIGLVTIVLGVKLAIETQNVLILLLSLLIGGAIGTVGRLEERLDALGGILQSRFAFLASCGSIPQAFVTASLLFCVGPMSILGALRDGLLGDWQMLGLKAVMDGVSSVVLVAGLGPGVVFSVLVVLAYQGGISLVAHALSGEATLAALSQSAWLIELDAAGGAILIALGLKLLELQDLRVGNLLPALAVAPLLVLLSRAVGG